jgi:hypothetical protein
MPRKLKVIDYIEPITRIEADFLRQLALRGSRFMVVGMTSAILQGADSATKDIDLWFEKTSDGKLSDAASSVGGVFMWRANPPCLGGRGLERFDVVNHMSGLSRFDDEYREAIELPLEDFALKLLPLERVVASKQQADRLKDRAAMPALLAALASRKYTA